MTRNEVLEAVDALERCDGTVDEVQRKALAAKVRLAFMATEQAWEEQDTLLQDFRQALPESERGPDWEQSVLAAIDTRREVLAAVDAHVPVWDPARPVAEVVGHLADELGEALDWKHLHAAEKTAREEMMAERDDLAGRLATEEAERIRCRDGWAEAVRIKDAALVCPLVMSAETARGMMARVDGAQALVRAVAQLKKPDGHSGDEESGQHDEDCELCHWEAIQAMAEAAGAEPVSPAYEFEQVAGVHPETMLSPSRMLALTRSKAERRAALHAMIAQTQTDGAYPELAPEADPYVSRVTEFHRAMGLPVRIVPSVGTVEERILRVRLLLEEVFEYATASAVRVELAGFRIKGTGELTIRENEGATPDLVAMTHELGDCQIVVSGTAAQLGLPLLPAVAEEIHPANMRKLGPDGRPVLRADGKVGKPEGWRPANVARIVERALTAGAVSHG